MVTHAVGTAAIFLKAADLLETKYRMAINTTTMLGQSKTLYQAEIDAACELIDFLRFNVSYLQDIYEGATLVCSRCVNRSEYRGLEGFVYAVSPFNFTSLAINLATAPALMAAVSSGNLPSRQHCRRGQVYSIA